MFIGYFFKGNPDSEVSRVTKAISRVQGNDKNSNPRDQDRELFIFFTYAYDTCLYANFSMGIQISRSQAKAIARVQVNNENGNPRDQDRE